MSLLIDLQLALLPIYIFLLQEPVRLLMIYKNPLSHPKEVRS